MPKWNMFSEEVSKERSTVRAYGLKKIMDRVREPDSYKGQALRQLAMRLEYENKVAELEGEIVKYQDREELLELTQHPIFIKNGAVNSPQYKSLMKHKNGLIQKDLLGERVSQLSIAKLELTLASVVAEDKRAPGIVSAFSCLAKWLKEHDIDPQDILKEANAENSPPPLDHVDPV